MKKALVVTGLAVALFQGMNVASANIIWGGIIDGSPDSPLVASSTR